MSLHSRSRKPQDTLTHIPMAELALARGVHTLTDRQKFEVLANQVEELLLNRMVALREEASAIQNDMQALMVRLEAEGSHVEMKDIRTARWYRTAAQIRALQPLLELAYKLGEKDGHICYMPPEIDDESDGLLSTTDDPSTVSHRTFARPGGLLEDEEESP